MDNRLHRTFIQQPFSLMRLCARLFCLMIALCLVGCRAERSSPRLSSVASSQPQRLLIHFTETCPNASLKKCLKIKAARQAQDESGDDKPMAHPEQEDDRPPLTPHFVFTPPIEAVLTSILPFEPISRTIPILEIQAPPPQFPA